MGKATILSNLGAGRYNVEIEFDNEFANARKEIISGEIDKIDSDLPNTQANLDQDKNNMLQAQANMMSFLEGYDPTVEIDIGQLNKLNTDFLKARVNYELAYRKYNIILLRRKNLINEYVKLINNAVNKQTMSVWCADRTENLTGTVGTIESCREIQGRPIIILPGHVNAAEWKAPYNGERDGILTTYWNQTPHQLYTNRAYLPALAKWKPRFRTGVITSKPSQDLANVNLDPFFSSQQNLDTNQTSLLTNVPIVYMTCNGKVFNAGDSVVVAFANDWSSRKIIGFTHDPKKCTTKINFTLNKKSHPIGTLITNSSWEQTYIFKYRYYPTSRDVYSMADGTSNSNTNGSGTKEYTNTISGRTYKVECEVTRTANSNGVDHGADVVDLPFWNVEFFNLKYPGLYAVFMDSTSTKNRSGSTNITLKITIDNQLLDTVEWVYQENYLATDYWMLPYPGGLEYDRYWTGTEIIYQKTVEIDKIECEDDGETATIKYFYNERLWQISNVRNNPEMLNQMLRDEITTIKTYQKKVVINKINNTRTETILDTIETSTTEYDIGYTPFTFGDGVRTEYQVTFIGPDSDMTPLPESAYGGSSSSTVTHYLNIPLNP